MAWWGAPTIRTQTKAGSRLPSAPASATRRSRSRSRMAWSRSPYVRMPCSSRSGRLIPSSSSKANPSSTRSRESAARSSESETSGVSSSVPTPSCAATTFWTLASRGSPVGRHHEPTALPSARRPRNRRICPTCPGSEGSRPRLSVLSPSKMRPSPVPSAVLRRHRQRPADSVSETGQRHGVHGNVSDLQTFREKTATVPSLRIPSSSRFLPVDASRRHHQACPIARPAVFFARPGPGRASRTRARVMPRRGAWKYVGNKWE